MINVIFSRASNASGWVREEESSKWKCSSETHLVNGNFRHSIYPVAVLVYPKCSWKKWCLFMEFSVPSFIPSRTHIPPFLLDKYKDTELISPIPQTNNGLNKKMCALWEGCFEDFFFFFFILINFFLSVYIYKHMYVTFTQTLVSGRNHSWASSQQWFRLDDWPFSLGNEKWVLLEGSLGYLS